MNQFTLHLGDCLTTLRGMADNSVDAVVTDPPYGLSFMGKKWDYDVPGVDVWTECLRVLKPGGHLLAFAGTRTQHRMAVRIEDAGFEIRDMIAWVYGSGFPKSLDVSKAIDKSAGAERPDAVKGGHRGMGARHGDDGYSEGHQAIKRAVPPQIGMGNITRGTPLTKAAREWQGWGTALKPALEPITVARKPFAQTVAANVLQWGTGALNIDGCRVDAGGEQPKGSGCRGVDSSWDRQDKGMFDAGRAHGGNVTPPAGRWPANLILSDCPEVVAGFPVTGKSTGGGKSNGDKFGGGYAPSGDDAIGFGDTGSAARFFYCAKASRSDRDAGLDGFEAQNNMRVNGPRESEDAKHATKRANIHPTVKPTDLMAYLVRLVTPPGGTVLDPFMGSGSTGKAAMREGFSFIGCELDPEYMAIARARIEHELATIEAARVLAAATKPIPQLDLFTS